MTRREESLPETSTYGEEHSSPRLTRTPHDLVISRTGTIDLTLAGTPIVVAAVTLLARGVDDFIPTRSSQWRGGHCRHAQLACPEDREVVGTKLIVGEDDARPAEHRPTGSRPSLVAHQLLHVAEVDVADPRPIGERKCRERKT
jgi:hypothetical protein